MWLFPGDFYLLNVDIININRLFLALYITFINLKALKY